MQFFYDFAPPSGARTAVAFLQNAWKRDHDGGKWDRDEWLRALGNSRSGQRLRSLLSFAGTCWVRFENTTQAVGDHPSSILPADPRHIRRVLRKHKPTYVVTLGKQAAEALLPIVQVPLLILPHPAYRVVTSKLFNEAGWDLCDGFKGVVEYVQRRGETVKLACDTVDDYRKLIIEPRQARKKK